MRDKKEMSDMTDSEISYRKFLKNFIITYDHITWAFFMISDPARFVFDFSGRYELLI